MGNKRDSHRQIVDRPTAERFAAERGLDAFLEVSARTGENVEEALVLVQERILQNWKETGDYRLGGGREGGGGVDLSEREKKVVYEYCCSIL